MDYFTDPELNGKYLGTSTRNFATVVTRVQPVDMFPHTHHMENVVLLELK